MSGAYRIILQKSFLYLVLVLLLILGSLFALFTFLASTTVGEVLGVFLFLIVGGLLIGGYMVGLMVLALLGITLLAGRTSGRSNQTSSKPAT